MGKFFKDFDWLIFLPALFLAGFSLSLLSSPGEGLFSSQLIFFVIGFVLFFLFSRIDWQIYRSFSSFVYIVSLLLLVVTFFGPNVRGASRWIEIFGFRWQPAELVKPFLAISLANFFSNHSPREFKNLFLGLLILLPPLFLIFRQPDLGNAIVLGSIWLGIVYASGLSFFLAFAGIITLFFLMPVGWFFLKAYQKARIENFLNPFFDPGGAGYNSIQAMIAVGSGQFFGRGLGQGTQSHLLFLPESHTDFIFAALVEELGFVGAGLVIVCYAILLLRILQIGRNLNEGFASLLTLGIFTQFFLQVFINIGMNMGFVPITGITLPLLSYGGSSVISSLLTLGILANISKSKRENRVLSLA